MSHLALSVAGAQDGQWEMAIAAAEEGLACGAPSGCAVTSRTGAERWRPHLHVEHAELHRLLSDSDAARHEFAEAHRLFAAMGATGFLPDLRSG